MLYPLAPPNDRGRRELLEELLKKELLKNDGVRDVRLVDQLTQIICEIISKTQIPVILPQDQSGASGAKPPDEPSEKIFWPVTIGELRYIADNVARKLKRGEATHERIKEIADEVVKLVVCNPLIKGYEYKLFIGDSKQYRYPPFDIGAG